MYSPDICVFLIPKIRVETISAAQTSRRVRRKWNIKRSSRNNNVVIVVKRGGGHALDGYTRLQINFAKGKHYPCQSIWRRQKRCNDHNYLCEYVGTFII